MSQQTYLLLFALICLTALILVIRCYIQTERILRWHLSRYYAAPRVAKCPLKRSRFHRLVQSICTFRIAG